MATRVALVSTAASQPERPSRQLSFGRNDRTGLEGRRREERASSFVQIIAESILKLGEPNSTSSALWVFSFSDVWR